jgi:hypothetical protein
MNFSCYNASLWGCRKSEWFVRSVLWSSCRIKWLPNLFFSPDDFFRFCFPQQTKSDVPAELQTEPYELLRRLQTIQDKEAKIK